MSSLKGLFKEVSVSTLQQIYKVSDTGEEVSVSGLSSSWEHEWWSTEEQYLIQHIALYGGLPLKYRTEILTQKAKEDLK